MKRAAGFLLGLLLAGCDQGTSGNSPGTGGLGPGDLGGTGGQAGDGGGMTSGMTGGMTGGGGATQAPYANVVAVAASGSDAAYTFGVSIESADIDCTQYADFWEVLSPDGALIYRRILDHSHTDENGTSDPDAPGNTFTRTGGPVPVAAADVVVVRAHMSNGGYNGRAMRGSVASGFADATEIGPDFAPGVETADPQPTSCAF